MRFPHPVPVNSEIRAISTLLELTEPAPDRLLMRTEFIVEIKGNEKPAMVAESLAMWVLGSSD